jgi:hypothetical protein
MVGTGVAVKTAPATSGLERLDLSSGAWPFAVAETVTEILFPSSFEVSLNLAAVAEGITLPSASH